MLHEMEAVRGGGGGCCCAARAFPQAHEVVGPSTDVQRIMLRFRPIAPRPAPPPPAGSGAASAKSPGEGLGGAPCLEKSVKKRRRAEDELGGSRRAHPTRTRRGPKPKQKAQLASAAEAAGGAASSTLTTSATTSEEEVAFVGPEVAAAMFALPLVPEAPAMTSKGLPPQFPTTELLQVTSEWWERPHVAPAGMGSHVIAPTPHRPVCSVVTVVESTAGEWEIAGDGAQQGSAGWLADRDELEAKQRLGRAARPALVSEPSGKVMWANAAYRRMVGAPDDVEEKAMAAADERHGVVNGGGVRTVLVAPAALLEMDVPAFSCRVKVRWCGAGRSGRPGPEKGSITAPCDVWRLAGGSLAWRIDVLAALSLGQMRQ